MARAKLRVTTWYDQIVDPDNIPLARPGVYRLVCLDTGLNYVGASKNVAERVRKHEIYKNGARIFVEPLYYSLTNDYSDLPDVEEAMFEAYNVFSFGLNTRNVTSRKAFKAQFKLPIVWITNGREDRRPAAGEPIPDGWRIGRSNASSPRAKMHQDSRHRMRAAKLGKIQITDGLTYRWINPSDEIPQGWRRGTYMTNAKGMVWINDGSTEAYTSPENIPSGWKQGRLHQPPAGKWITNGLVNRRIADGTIPDGWQAGVTRH